MGGGVVKAVVALAVVAAMTSVARAEEPGELRDVRGFDLSGDAQVIGPDETVGLFQGSPAYRQVLLRWPEPEGQELALTLEYSGAVEHRRFDFRPTSGYLNAPGVFGEWSLCLNGHAVWTGNLAPYLFNGEVPGEPHRDSSGQPVDGCWRTCGFGVCDLAYSSGGSSGDVELLGSGGALVQFGYPGNSPTGGNPCMLPNDPSLAWRARLDPPAQVDRAFMVKKPDGSTWRFNEVPLTLRWPGYFYNMNEGPRAFRLSSATGLTGAFEAHINYEYADSGAGKCAFLHPTAVHVTDQAGRSMEIRVELASGGGSCEVTVLGSTSPRMQWLEFTARTYVDPSLHVRRSHLFDLDSWTDRAGLVTRFRYENDDREEAFPTNCSDSLQIRARRLAGANYPAGGSSTYLYVPLPMTRPSCPDARFRYQDSAWRSTGRTPALHPMARRVEVRESAGAAPVQTVDFVYSWNSSPSEGDPLESESYRYHTLVSLNRPGPPLPHPVRPLSLAGAPGVSVDYEFFKIPHQPQTHGGPSYNRWAPRELTASVTLASGETHTLLSGYDAVPSGTGYSGTLMPVSRTYRVTSALGTASYAVAYGYDSLARVTYFTDAAGARHELEYDEQPSLHSPWSGTGRYAVRLLARERVTSVSTGTLLSENWNEREPVFGRVMASHRRLDPGRVAHRTYAYDPQAPWRVARSDGPGGELAEFSYGAELIPNTLGWAGSPGEEVPARISLHPDAQGTRVFFQGFDGEGRLLRTADGSGHMTSRGFDGDGRLNTLAFPGDVMTGPPPPDGGKLQPQLPPYDLTPWPSGVRTYLDAPGNSSVRSTFYSAMSDSLPTQALRDGLGRLRLRRFLGGAGGAAESYEYDAFGRLATAHDLAGGAWSYAHDELGRMISTSDPEGHSSQFDFHTVPGLSTWGVVLEPAIPSGYFEARIAHMAGGAGAIRAVDAAGRLRVTALLPMGSNAPVGLSSYEYDEAGNMASLHGPDGSTTRADYDMAGHLRHVGGAGGRARTWIYDLAGRPAFAQDENGAGGGTWAYFRYDATGRLLEEGTASASSESQLQALADAGQLPPGASWLFRFGYDSPTDPNGEGALTRVVTRLSGGLVDAVDFQHDPRGRVTRKDLSFAGLAVPLTVGYAYDRQGRRTSVLLPSGRTLKLTYDPALGGLAGISLGSRPLVSVTTDPAGRPVQLQNGAVSEERQYGPSGQLAVLNARVNGLARFSEVFEQDVDGRLVNRAALTDSRWEVSRDEAARLARLRFSDELGTPSLEYRHNAAGDLDSVSSDLVGHRARWSGRRLVEWTRSPLGRDLFSYDPHGNLVRRVRLLGVDTLGTLDLRWSVRNELLAVIGSAGGRADSVAYVYDAWGRRSRKTRAGSVTFFLRDESGELLAEIDSGGGTVREYVRASGRLYGAIESDGSYSGYVQDGLGSARLGVGQDGAVRFRQDFLPYGELSQAQYGERPSIGYLGAEQDAETGFCYLKQRYYDPGTARFLSPDPLRSAGLPEYAYALGDPLTFSDPGGLAPDGVDSELKPAFSLPEIVVRASGLAREGLIHWVLLRLARTLQGGDDFLEPGRSRTPSDLLPPGPAREIARDLGGRIESAVEALRRGGNPTLGLARVPGISAMTGAAGAALRHTLIAHELIALAKVAPAIDRMQGLTPAQRDALRLKAGVVLLSELTLDSFTVLALSLVPEGARHAETLGGLLEGRGAISDYADRLLEQIVPGYDDVSVIGDLTGDSGDDP